MWWFIPWSKNLGSWSQIAKSLKPTWRGLQWHPVRIRERQEKKRESWGKVQVYHKAGQRAGWGERRRKVRRREGRGGKTLTLAFAFPNTLLIPIFLQHTGPPSCCMLLETLAIFPFLCLKGPLHSLMWQLIMPCLVHFPKVLNSSLGNLCSHPY